MYHLRNINRIRQHLNSKAAQQVVHAFVTSRIDMYNSTYFGLPNLQINRIQKVLNAAARMITRQRLSDHITPTLQQLHWLPVKQRIVFKVLTLTVKALSGECPAYLADLINVQQTRRTGLRSGDGKNYLKGDAEDSGGIALSWQRLHVYGMHFPWALKESQSLQTFKKNLKSFLFEQSFM